MKRLSLLIAACSLVTLVASCKNDLTEGHTTHTWYGDLPTSQGLLVMKIPIDMQGSFTGFGSINKLTNVGEPDALTIVGTRVADTLTVIFSKASGDQFRFNGWYVGKGSAISGKLNGSTFVNQGVNFVLK